MGSTDFKDKDVVYNIMDVTQSNYANMLKRLQMEKDFSSLVMVYYSIAVMTYSITAKFFPEYFNEEVAEYFNIILSIVLLAYSLISSNAKYAERIQAVQNTLNAVKVKKRELTKDNVEEKRREYENIIKDAEYRSEKDFFWTLMQKCRINKVKWYCYREGINCMKESGKVSEANKLNNYLSENFPFVQMLNVCYSYFIKFIIVLSPIVVFVICFFFK